MKVTTISLLAMLLVLPAAVFSADKAYMWTDANGTRHYSEEPPFDGNVSAVEIDLMPAPSAGNIGGNDDFYSVINQANRMEQQRLEKEKRSSEKVQVEIELDKVARDIQLKLSPEMQDTLRQISRNNPPPRSGNAAAPVNSAAREYTRYNPAYPQNAGNRIPAAPYSQPLQARPGVPGQPPEYVHATPPGTGQDTGQNR